MAVPGGKEVFGRGGAAVIEPASREVIAGPLYDEEGIVEAECDLRVGRARVRHLLPERASPASSATPIGTLTTTTPTTTTPTTTPPTTTTTSRR